MNENELSLMFEKPGNYTLNIYNITGQLINTYDLTEALVKINLAYLTPGTYIAQIVELTENNSFKLLIPSTK
ncbi:MAG: T9SS type A sorting domain-containing protein [Bacteroidetes bacterium]|nr:T9SS type A sorting domain-containing protein [Bacteroidota bacterium]